MPYDASFHPTLGDPFGGTEMHWAAAKPTATMMKSESYSIKRCSPVRYTVSRVHSINQMDYLSPIQTFVLHFSVLQLSIVHCVISFFLRFKALNPSEFDIKTQSAYSQVPLVALLAQQVHQIPKMAKVRCQQLYKWIWGNDRFTS